MWLTILILAIILGGVLGLLKLLRADFMFKLYAAIAGTIVAGLFLGFATCLSLGVLCDVARLAATALDVLSTPPAIAIVIVFGGIEREAKKRKWKRKNRQQQNTTLENSKRT